MNKRTVIAAGALALVVAVGCAAEGELDTSVEAVTTTDAPRTPTRPRPTTTTTEADSGILAVGEAFTWEDNLTVIVTSIEARPLDPGYGPVVPDGVVVTVQVQNNTGAVYDGPLMTNLTYGAAGVEASSAYYSNEGLTGGLSGPVPPGGTATVTVGFEGVADPSVLTVSIEPGFEYIPGFWSTAP